MIPSIRHSGKHKFIRIEISGEGKETDYKGAPGYFWTDGRVLDLKWDSGYATVCIHQNPLNCTPKKGEIHYM